MTTPAFSTWSRMSNSEASSAASAPMVTTSGALVAITGCEGIRRPGTSSFQPKFVFALRREILQYCMELLAPGARDQERCLPNEVALACAYAACRCHSLA